MKEEKIELTFVKANFNELDISEQELIEKAKNAYSNAYAPYSGFLVGAALLLENNEIIEELRKKFSRSEEKITKKEVFLMLRELRNRW